MHEEKNTGDKDKIEDKYFKQSIPGLNRLLNVLGIPGYRDETKTMDLVFDLKSKETLNLEFKSTYVKKEDIEKSLDYATYLRIKYKQKTNSYFISTVQKKDSEYEDEWHNDNRYKIPLKTFKEFSGEEHLENLKDLLEKNEIDDETEELNDLLLIPFMESDKSPKELIVECITLANQIRTVNRDKLNDIKNLLLFLATKYTDTDEEFDEIERLVKMEGGMIQNTVKQMKRIYGEKGIDSVAIELEKIGIESELIEKVTDKAKKEIQKQWKKKLICEEITFLGDCIILIISCFCVCYDLCFKSDK